MQNSAYLSCNDVPWQASSPCMFFHFRDKMKAAIQAPENILDRTPRKLTEEAIYMIHVMLVFVGLAILGSSVNAYEFFYKRDKKKSEYHINGNNKNIPKTEITVLKKKNSFEIHDFSEDFKAFLKCFCLFKNGGKILSTATKKGQIDCLQGLRVLSNAAVIISHTGFMYVGILRRLDDLKPLLDLRVSQLGLNTMFGVDVFFIISGYLNARTFFHTYCSNNGNISWFYFYWKRFLRLTPVYMLVVGFNATLFTYTGAGILWPTYNTNPICQKYWWWHLLYVNNLGESSKQCMAWGWSLAADYQLYIISPLFMVSLIRWPKLGYALISACISGSCITSFLLTYQNNLLGGFSQFEFQMDDLKTFTNKLLEYFDVLHIKPYTRLNSYLVAILLAYYLHKNSNRGTVKNKAWSC